ncbi:MAG: ABC transporter permease [Roseiarcus sp.]|jgi:ribose transport system permease protein
MRSWRPTQEGIVFVLSALMFCGFSVLLPGFLAVENVLSLIRSVSILGILSLGMALVVIGRGIDLAMVATLVVAVAWAMALAHSQMPLGLALALGAVFVVGVGATTGLIVAFAEIPAIFTTLAMGSIVYGIGRTFFFQIDVQNAPAGYPWFTFLGAGRIGGIPVIVLAFAAMAILMFAALRQTRFGRFVYASGDNPLAARITGIPTRVLTVSQYVASGLIAYCAGIVMAAAVSGMNTRIYNSTMIYDVLLVVVLGGIGLGGGRGGVRNVVVGTALVGILLNGMTILNVGYTAQNLIKSVILLAAIVIDTIVNPRDEQTAQQGDI